MQTTVLTPVQKAFLAALPLSFLALVVNLGTKAWLATLIDREALALFFTALDIFALSLLILVGFRSSMTVAYTQTQDDLRIINLFRGVLLAAILFTWALSIPYLKHRLGVNIHYWYLVSLLLATGLKTYLGNQLGMYRMYRAINQSTYLEPLFILIWFVIAWYGSDLRGLHSLFVATIMGSLTLSLYLFWLKYRHHIAEPPIRLVQTDAIMQRFLRQSVISTVEFGSGIVMMYLAVLLLLKYHDTAVLGNFQVVVKPVLMGLITLMVLPVFRFFLPELSKAWQQEDMETIHRLRRWHSRLSLAISTAVTLLFIVAGAKAIALLFPAPYRDAYRMLLPLILFFPFIMLNAFQLALVKATGRFAQALFIRLSGIGFFLLFFYILRLFTQSYSAVIMALALGYMGMWLLSTLLVRHIMAQKAVAGR